MQQKCVDLDTDFAQVVVEVAEGPLKAELLTYRESQSRIGRALSCRAALWHLYRRFRFDYGAALSMDLHTLVGLHFSG